MENRVVCDSVERDVGPVIRIAPGLLNTENDIDRLWPCSARPPDATPLSRSEPAHDSGRIIPLDVDM